MRVALAGVLFASPTTCFWTNRPTIWTSKARSGWKAISQRYPHTVLIISHDRGLLNRAVRASCISTTAS
jgi:ATP-binding cassette subfamily F protein 3